MNAYKVVDTELIEDLSKPDKEPDKEKRVEREGDSKPGKLPKKELNKLLVSAIVRRLKKLYFSVPKSEDRILIEETLEDLIQLMLLNSIAIELLKGKETKK